MISWETTVAPQTSFSGSSENSTIRNQGPGAAAAITITQRGTTTSSYNWSQTQYSSIRFVDADESSGSYISVLGTTNSTSGNSYTLRSVINVTTTETTRQYFYRPTQTATVGTSAHTTTTFQGKDGTFAFSASATATITTTADYATTSETCLSTTTGPDTIATPIRATVYVADKNEVLLVAPSFAASDASGYTAATAVLTTATQTTLMPWTQTVVAPTANTTQTTSYAQPEVSGSVSFHTLATGFETRTTASNFFSLPNKTEEINWQTYELGTSAISFTALSPETITATGSVSLINSAVASVLQTSGTIYGSSYVTTATSVATVSRNQTLPWAESSISTSRPTIGALVGTGTNTTAYTWTMTFDATTANSLTTFAAQPQGVTIYSATSLSEISRDRRFVAGVSAASGVAAGYDCPQLGLIQGLPLVSRNVVSLTVGTIEYSTTYFTSGSDEFGEFEVDSQSLAGSATISGLSVTAQDSTTTATTSFIVSGFGQTTYHFANLNTSKIDASLLGQSETVYATAKSGVYSSESTTFSTTGGASSWSAGGGSQAALVPLSYVAAGTNTTPHSILWSTSRNSHQSHSVLTSADAYRQL